MRIIEISRFMSMPLIIIENIGSMCLVSLKYKKMSRVINRINLFVRKRSLKLEFSRPLVMEL